MELSAQENEFTLLNEDANSTQVLTGKVVNHWNNLLRDVVDFPSLAVFKSRLDAFQKEML